MERTHKMNVRLKICQTSLEVKNYRTQVCGQKEMAGGSLKVEQEARYLCRVVKMIMMMMISGFSYKLCCKQTARTRVKEIS